MAKAADILKIAQSQIGIKEDPPDSNHVKYNTQFYGRPVYGSKYPWCCAFVWWVFKEANAPALFYDGQKTAFCPTAMNWFKNKGQFVTGGYRPGDVVFFNFNHNPKNEPGHIGIIESVNPDGSLQCIEGNTSLDCDDNGGSVMRRTRKLSLVVGAGRPAYETGIPGPSPTGGGGYSQTDFIKDLQKAIGVAVDGIAGPVTLAHTVTISAQKNPNHPAVKPVQQYLLTLNYVQVGAADGQAGPKFTAAVMAYQKDNHCTADGEITAQRHTWKKLLGMS